MTWFYADCCLFNQQPEAGLDVVQPLLAAMQKRLDEGTDTEMSPRQYAEEIARLAKLRAQFEALKK